MWQSIHSNPFSAWILWLKVIGCFTPPQTVLHAAKHTEPRTRMVTVITKILILDGENSFFVIGFISDASIKFHKLTVCPINFWNDKIISSFIPTVSILFILFTISIDIVVFIFCVWYKKQTKNVNCFQRIILNRSFSKIG